MALFNLKNQKNKRGFYYFLFELSLINKFNYIRNVVAKWGFRYLFFLLEKRYFNYNVFLNSSFVWFESKQGHNYWMVESDKYDSKKKSSHF